MNKTTKNYNEIDLSRKLAVDTEELQQILSLGRKSAVEVGKAANAQIMVGKRIIWNLQRVQEYLYNVAA
ncbi:hypothetical protein [Anaerocolumna aminovalerica]|uniref:hypothetical protein n=1 Tax=Anaerocolumna aminovalerica TaxID=1527 RepID=UPI00248C05CA|nr:hypothetical protein [Anaerocolumna aminovalerica]